MPELPEVETTVRQLKTKVLKRTFVDVWSDWGKIVKKPKSFKYFKKQIKGKKIESVKRRGKNVIFELSKGYSLLVHQKMTGHLLIGDWVKVENRWKPKDEKSPLNDPYNRFLHLVFFLDNGKILALSDARKFAKVELQKTEDVEKEMQKIGPEPLAKSFVFATFKKTLSGKKGKIRHLLMKPEIIAGIGNIYVSEILWKAKIHPETDVGALKESKLHDLFSAIKKVLELGVMLGGESFSDYRKPDGTRGDFDTERNVYKREGQKCSRCGAVIIRKKIGARSAFFCPSCQKIRD